LLTFETAPFFCEYPVLLLQVQNLGDLWRDHFHTKFCENRRTGSEVQRREGADTHRHASIVVIPHALFLTVSNENSPIKLSKKQRKQYFKKLKHKCVKMLTDRPIRENWRGWDGMGWDGMGWDGRF
jgi:hypothetical protein